MGGATELYGAALYRLRKEDFGELKHHDGISPAWPFSTCVRCMDCDGFPCVVHAKSDAEVLAVRPALEYPNVTLLTNAHVVKLNTNPTVIEKWFPERRTCVVLPFVVAIAFFVVSFLPASHPYLGILAFAVAGLGCSALLPLTMSFAEELGIFHFD